jgi:Protein of unknown function (DUF2924)
MSPSKAFQPSLSVVAQVTRLPDMTIKEIKALWRELYKKDPPTHVRSFLEKRLAYRLQELEFKKTHPGLIEKNQRRIQAIIDTNNKPLRDRSPKPVPGTVLTRWYQDKEYQVIAMQDGQFEFEGRPYKSLSVIAR